MHRHALISPRPGDIVSTISLLGANCDSGLGLIKLDRAKARAIAVAGLIVDAATYRRGSSFRADGLVGRASTTGNPGSNIVTAKADGYILVCPASGSVIRPIGFL